MFDPRKIAAAILRLMIRVSPHDVRPWGEAMLAETGKIERPWEALRWGLEGAGVLSIQILLNLFSHDGQETDRPQGLFGIGKEIAMQKAKVITGAACLAVAGLFFFAPSFRQGLNASLAGWYPFFHINTWNGQSSLKSLASKVEAAHDPDGLAFCAVRLDDTKESVRLAGEAVGHKPELIWVYAVVAVRHPTLPEIETWLPQLEKWDPNNALFALIRAESIDIGFSRISSNLSPNELKKRMDEDPAWRGAMAAVFHSSKFDDYLLRLRELDRRVVMKYGFDEPSAVLAGETYALPSYAFWDSERFAKSILKSGEDLAIQSKRKEAADQYWAVAEFGQLMESQSHTEDEAWIGADLQTAAYKRLQTVAQWEGNSQEAELFGYLSMKSFRSSIRAGVGPLVRSTGQEVPIWSATVVKISGALILFFGGALLVCGLIVKQQSGCRRPGNPGGSRISLLLGLACAAGLAFSSTTLYVAYRPYSRLFDRFINAGDVSQFNELFDFFGSTHVLLGFRNIYRLPDFVFYFWGGVIVLAFVGLTLIALKHVNFRSHAPSNA